VVGVAVPGGDVVSAVLEGLARVMETVQAVAKKDRNTHQNFNFRGIDAVVNAVGPALRMHGIIVVPSDVDVTYADVQTTTGKPATACRVKVTYTFAATDGSTWPTTVVGEAWDAGDKATPKAMSVAFRTALLQALALPTDDPDPDTHTYERAAVDLAPLEALIVTAEDVGLSKDWAKAREFAARSPAHLQKTLNKLRADIKGSPVVAEGDGKPPAPATGDTTGDDR
jgi:hypothetical protein